MKLYQPLPIAIIAFCLQDGGGRRINAFRIYTYLNLRNDGGGFHLTVKRKEQMGRDLNLAVPTINKWLREDLAALKWVRKSHTDGRTYVSGFKDVMRRLPPDLQAIGSTVEFDPEIRVAPAEKFKAWICGAFIADLVRYMNRQSHKGKLSESEELQGRNFKRSVPKENSASRFWWAISATMIETRLGVAKATAVYYRQLAKQYGFIKVKHNRRHISDREYQMRKAMGGKEFAMIHDDGNGRFTVDETHEIYCGYYSFKRLTAYRSQHSYS